MQFSRFARFSLAAAVLAVGAVGAQQTGLPQEFSYEGEVAAVNRVPPVTPLVLSTQDISWNGTGGVSFNFTINQRARVWVAVYRKGSNETGARGPFGAWLRLQPMDLYVWSSAGIDVESGNNTIDWDGLDFEGNAAGAGSYEFDLMAFNVLDQPALAGVSTRTGFADNVIDLRTGEIWVGEYDRDAPYVNHRAGDVIRATLGTDYVNNQDAWERWDYNNVLDFEGARTWGGLRPDPDEQDVYWTTHEGGDGAGIYKMRIDRAARSWDLDTGWADNGVAPPAGPGIQIRQMETWQGFLVAANWSGAELPASSVEFWNKDSGEVVKQLDVAAWYTEATVDNEDIEILEATGPGELSVDDTGVWLASWASTNIVKVDHDGNILWVNGPGDLIGDRVTYEQAAATGLPPESAYPIRILADYSSNVAYFSPRHNSLGSLFSAVGRDGTGLFHVFADPSTVGPMIPSQTTFMVLVSHDRATIGGTPIEGPNAGQRGPWDGFYTDGCTYSLDGVFGYQPAEKFGPGMLFHVPYDMVSGRLGASGLGASFTVVESVESAGTPDSYTLGEAYPNPFNPETAIEFSLPRDGYVKIDVYNAVGQRLSSLVDEELSAGSYKTAWDGHDAQGQEVSSGVYFYRMQAGSYTDTRSMTLLK